jgi:myosin-18
MTLDALTRQIRPGNERSDNNDAIKHKGDMKHSDSEEYKLKSTKRDDISFTALSKAKFDREEKEKPTGAGLVRVQLEESQEIVEVDRRFIEKAGPKNAELPADLKNAGELNESELLSILAARFRGGEYQTMLGDSCMLSINPMKRTDSGCGRTSRARKLVPELGMDILLQQVETVYRAAVSTNTPHSIVLTGRSGAGKTCNFKKALGYLIDTTQPQEGSVFTAEKLYAVDCLLESFCSTRTTLNTHATRMVQMIQLSFDQSGNIAGGSLEMALPDAGRLLRSGRRAGEPTFPILYQVQAALGKSNLFLPPRMLVDNAFFTPLQDETEIMTALEDWGRVCMAMEVLGMEQEEEETFWLILAAITNLGVIAKQMESSGCYQCDPTIVAKVSETLGISQDDFKKVVTRPATPRTVSPASSLTPSTASSRSSTPTRSMTSTTAVLSPSLEQQAWSGQDGSPLVLDNVNRLAVNLYAELLTRLVSLINRSIRAEAKHSSSIILFDSPGLQNPSCVGERPSAGFVELCYNYLQERLQLLFSSSQVEQLEDRDRSVARLLLSKRTNSSPMISLIDRTNPAVSDAPQPGVWAGGVQTLGRRNSKRVRFTQSPPGLFTLLHKATNCPWSDDHTFVQRLAAHWGGQNNGALIVTSGETETQFTLGHLQGTACVRYNAQGWRHISYSMGRTNLATEVLRRSARPELRTQSQDPLLSSPVAGQAGLTLEDIKAKMSCLQVKVQVDTIMKVLTGTKVNFIVCMQPHNLAGLCELFRKSPGRNLNQKLLRDQLRGHQILDYLLSIKELGKIQQSIKSSKLAMGELVTQYSNSVVVTGPNSQHTHSLAGNLWQGLQVAVITAVSNIDLLESAVQGISKSITMPASSMARVLDDTGTILLNNGRVSLNLDCMESLC